MTAPAERLLGDLHARADGGFDGWCWAPDRPQARLVVDLLVNDRPAVSMVAALFRPDLIARGCGDGYHGFALRLPPGVMPSDEETLISARERRSGRVFGRVLRAGPGRRPPGLMRAEAAAASVAALSQEIGALQPPQGAQARLRATFGALAGVLSGHDPVRPPPPVPAPTLAVVLQADAAHRRAAALAPALAGSAVELLVADLGATPGAALRQAARAARAPVLVLLDAAPARPSAAALLALARAVAAAPDQVLLGSTVIAAAAALAHPLSLPEPVRLPAPLGVLIGGARALWHKIGADAPETRGNAVLACADLALRARLLGHPWRRVQEPATPAPPHPGRAAAAALHARWGFGA